MIVGLDITVEMDDGQALGSITGKLELEIVPSKGDKLSFLFPPKGTGVGPYVGFPGVLSVNGRIFRTTGGHTLVGLELGAIKVKNLDEANRVFNYFEVEYGFFSDSYD